MQQIIFFADFIACLKTKAPNTTGSDHPYNALQLLMMDIVVPETC